MRILIASALLCGFVGTAGAEDDPPKCTVTKVNGQGTSIDVQGVWAQGAKWAEYNCRTYGEKAVIKHALDSGACANPKTLAVKWSTSMGKPGAEKTWESTMFCSKVLKSAGTTASAPSAPSAPATTAPTTSPSSPTIPAPLATSPSKPMPGKPITGGGRDFDPSGWEKLGERSVNGKIDKDTIYVGKYKGRFAKLSLVVLESDLELLGFEIKFDKGMTFQPVVRHTFREGSRSRVIDLPGDERVIKQVTLRYKNTAGGGRARVQVWAR